METYFIVIHIVIYVAIGSFFAVKPKPRSRYIVEAFITGLFWPLVVFAVIVCSIVGGFQEYFKEPNQKG